MPSSDKTKSQQPKKKSFKPQMSYLPRQMVAVPGFKTPFADEKNLVPQPNPCSQEASNEYRSAGVLLKALAAEARAWAQQLPVNYRPAIVAILHGGVEIQVRSLAQVSFEGIRIEGTMGEDIPCSLLAHQDTIQLVCHAIRIDETPEEAAKNPIGFIWSDHKEQI